MKNLGRGYSLMSLFRKPMLLYTTSTLHKELSEKLKNARIGKTTLFFSIIMAIINGDIIMERKEEEKNKTKIKTLYLPVTDPFDSLRIILKDRNGNIINPTPFDDKYLD